MNERVDRLRALLEEPLLVTTGVNVRYLVGFQSSNAALLVDEQRVLLFTDFRYADAARRVEGVEFVQTERSLLKSIAEQLDGRVGFEAAALPYADWQTSRTCTSKICSLLVGISSSAGNPTRCSTSSSSGRPTRR